MVPTLFFWSVGLARPFWRHRLDEQPLSARVRCDDDAISSEDLKFRLFGTFVDQSALFTPRATLRALAVPSLCNDKDFAGQNVTSPFRFPSS